LFLRKHDLLIFEVRAFGVVAMNHGNFPLILCKVQLCTWLVFQCTVLCTFTY